MTGNTVYGNTVYIYEENNISDAWSGGGGGGGGIILELAGLRLWFREHCLALPPRRAQDAFGAGNR
jgi:hypothetical protein